MIVDENRKCTEGETLNRRQKSLPVEKLFLILMVIFGLLFLFIQPIYSVPDEGNHFHTSYAIFHDDYKGDEFRRYFKNEDIESSRDKSYFKKTFVDKQDFRKNKLAFNFTYKDIQLLPQAIGEFIGELIYPSLGIVFYFGRLMNLILYTGAIYFAIKKAKFAQLLMATITLLPISIQQAASLSYDVMFYVLIFISFSFITNLAVRREKLSPRFYIFTCLIILSFFLTKLSIFLMGLYFVTLPVELLGDNWLSKTIDKFWAFCDRHKQSVVLFACLIILFYIRHVFKDYGGLTVGLQVFINTFFRADFNVTLDSIVTTGMIGTFGSLLYRIPEWLVIINFIFLVMLAFCEEGVIIKKRMAVASFSIWMLNIIVVGVTMYLSWTIGALKHSDTLVSLGTQGRYYTPFLIGLAPIGIVLRQYIKVRISPNIVRKLFMSLMLFNLVFSLLLIIVYNYSAEGGYDIILKVSERLHQLVK